MVRKGATSLYTVFFRILYFHRYGMVIPRWSRHAVPAERWYTTEGCVGRRRGRSRLSRDYFVEHAPQLETEHRTYRICLEALHTIVKGSIIRSSS